MRKKNQYKQGNATKKEDSLDRTVASREKGKVESHSGLCPQKSRCQLMDSGGMLGFWSKHDLSCQTTAPLLRSMPSLSASVCEWSLPTHAPQHAGHEAQNVRG